MNIPYVYWLKNKTTGMKYIGIKYARGADPTLFWKTYFTSSKHVKKLVKLFGKEDFIFRILKTFDTAFEALQYENKLNRLAFQRKDYLNLHYNFLGDKTEQIFLLETEKQRKIAKIYGDLSYQLKTGLHSLSKEERDKACSLGGVAAEKINRELGRAIFDPEVRVRQHSTLRREQKSAFYDPSLRSRISSLGGKAGIFTKTYYQKNELSESDRIEAQRDRGRRGGPKNKGFRWYNDGNKSYKYTLSQQKQKGFDSFITDSGFVAGKLPNNASKIWVNDGNKNYMIVREQYTNEYRLGRLGDKGKYNGHKNKENNKDGRL